jgi:acyl carrier protein
VNPRCESPDALLDATRHALAACSDGLDVSAVQPETPLAALVFDSLMALNFIASLESVLGVADLPFERWLAEHSESTDAVTIGSLVAWLRSLPEVGALGDGAAPVEEAAGVRRATGGGSPEDR